MNPQRRAWPPARWIVILLLAHLAWALNVLVAAPPGPAERSIRFVVIGDGGTGNKYQKKVADQMVAYHDRYAYDFVLMVGDNIYSWGNPKDYPKKFEIPYATLLARGVKFYAALGNHDVRSGNWASAIKYPLFNMGGRRYYTFTRGDGLAQFFALDSTTLDKRQQDPDQLRWLREELGASSAPWKIAYFHHPIYSSGKTHGSDLKLRAVLEPILMKGGVRAVFSGHDHFYERIAPQQGIQYFVTGAAGQLRRGNIDRRTGLTLKGNDQVRHFMYVEINEQEMRFQAVSEDGEVIDSGSIPAPTPNSQEQRTPSSINASGVGNLALVSNLKAALPPFVENLAHSTLFLGQAFLVHKRFDARRSQGLYAFDRESLKFGDQFRGRWSGVGFSDHDVCLHLRGMEPQLYQLQGSFFNRNWLPMRTACDSGVARMPASATCLNRHSRITADEPARSQIALPWISSNWPLMVHPL